MNRRIARALSLGLGCGLLLLLASHSPGAHADPRIVHVALGGDCNGALPCYGDIQAAVDAAGEGDEIRVAAATYTGVSARAGLTQTLYISKTVTIRGGYNPADWDTPDPLANLTTLDAAGEGRVLYIAGGVAPTVEGLRITGGDAAGQGGGLGGADAGGGVYIDGASAIISGSLIYGNTAYRGAGL